MTKKEAAAMFGLISALYPRDEKFSKADKESILAWHEMLADIPFDVAKAAIKASVATSPFPPQICDIRNYATRITGERRLTADEAWGIACDMMRTYGLRTVYKDGYAPQAPSDDGERRKDWEKIISEKTAKWKSGGVLPNDAAESTNHQREYKAVKVQPNSKEYEAKRHCPTEVWKIIENIGYADMVKSENPDVVRGQFMRAWSNHDKEEYEKRVIGGVLPEFLKGLNLLGGGQNGELNETNP